MHVNWWEKIHASLIHYYRFGEKRQTNTNSNLCYEMTMPKSIIRIKKRFVFFRIKYNVQRELTELLCILKIVSQLQSIG